MRGEQDIPTLSRNIVTYLAQYLGAQVGALYVADPKGMLQLSGSFAYTRRKGLPTAFAPGDGLVGQAALTGPEDQAVTSLRTVNLMENMCRRLPI